MQDLGKAKLVLGIRISQEKEEIALDQSKYIEDILDRFNMSHCKPVGTPLEVNKDWLKLKGDENVCSNKLPYQRLIASCMWQFVAVQTLCMQ